MITKWGEGMNEKFGVKIYTVLYIKQIINKDYYIAQENILNIL